MDEQIVIAILCAVGLCGVAGYYQEIMGLVNVLSASIGF